MCISEDPYTKQTWRSKYPSIVGALLSTFQMLLTIAIVGCEVGGDFVRFNQMNVFVGYWTFPLFMCAWISLAGASCCCRIRCCGITALVFQILAIPMALCVIGFDAYFLNNPTLCFFSPCTSYYYNYYYSSSSSYSYYIGTDTSDILYTIKVPLIKGQLAAGSLMFVSCLIYIIIFVITSILVQKSNNFQSGTTVPPNNAAVYPSSYVLSNIVPVVPAAIGPQVLLPPPPPPPPVPIVPQVILPPPPYNAPIAPVTKDVKLICNNCRSRFYVAIPQTQQ